MKVNELLRALHREASDRAYIVRLEVLDQSATMLKVRLFISPDLFVQVYRNDRFDTTNLVLIHNEQRVYARDRLDGVWHRHTAAAPHLHDTSTEGCQPVTLSKFLDEVENVLAEKDLP
jgi:hypothetical protein